VIEMKLGILLAGALALTTVTAGPVLAQAPAAAQELQGRTVLGADGAVLGEVERVTTRSDGRPAQVLVRPKGQHPAGLRSLAYAALKIEGGAVSVPLTKAEFNAMPAVESAPK
jgi:hypothetical protein